MTLRTRPPARLFPAVDATWPPHRLWQQDGWTFRDGRGGGKRVSAATLAGPPDSADVAIAERVMTGMGQPALFMIRPQDAALDAALDRAGYRVIDPVTVLVAPIEDFLQPVPLPSIQIGDVPTTEMAAVWQAGGIGPARLDVMRRCALPKACIGLRDDGVTAAVAYAAVAGGLAMCHAVEVLQDHRRRGMGRTIMDAVIDWARGQGAQTIGVLTVRENTTALALYRGMGFVEASGYHYRIKPA